MPTDAARRISAFLKAAGELFGAHDSDIAAQVSEALKAADPAPLVLSPASHPASEAMEGLIARAEGELMRHLRICAADLHWRTAGFGKLPEQAAQKLTVVELAGPTGMVRVDNLRFGLLVQREGFQYPPHRHAAEELYFVLAGTAHWAVDDDPPALRPPGSFVHHRSLQPHSMRTEAEPMLALWAWAGDIGGSSYAI